MASVLPHPHPHPWAALPVELVPVLVGVGRLSLIIVLGGHVLVLSVNRLLCLTLV